MDKMREKHVAEMQRLKDAISRTDSVTLKRDYQKAYRRMEKDLRLYDAYRKESAVC